MELIVIAALRSLIEGSMFDSANASEAELTQAQATQEDSEDKT